MSKTRIVIIEDEFFVAEHLSSLVNSLGFWVVGTFHSGEDFLKGTDWNFDAAIVDIFLSKAMSGLQVAEYLQKRHKPFIFLTANQDSQTLKQAARLSPKAYISKPFQQNDIVAALQIITYNLAPKVKVRGAKGVEMLSAEDILFVKGDGAYVEIHTRKGSIVQRKLLKEIEEELPDFFVRVHRSFLVNEHEIEQRSSSALKIHNHEIPISRTYRDKILR